MVAKLSELTGVTFVSCGNLFEGMQSTADFLDLSGALRTLATTLTRIANDLRLLSSGPTTGLGEITLPAVQPGSSIMPGKVNPVMAEMLNMVCYHVHGQRPNGDGLHPGRAVGAECDDAHHRLQSVAGAGDPHQRSASLHRALRAGHSGQRGAVPRLAERSMGLATALNPYIGYAAAAKVAQEALARGVSLRQVALERGYLTEEQLEAILDPIAMTEPGIPGKKLEP
jgi:fumarate hydratase class II